MKSATASRRSHKPVINGAAALCFLLTAWANLQPARAQETDLLLTLKPVVMLAIDTSGSMQWRSPGLNNDPQCRLSNSTDKSRQIVLQEVLTGTFQDYQLKVNSHNTISCSPGDYQPSSSGVFPPTQDADGILDSYKERIRFALSTFDNNISWAGDGGGGDWSYGTHSPSAIDFEDEYWAELSSCSFCSTNCVNEGGKHWCQGNLGIKSERQDGGPCTGTGCLISVGESHADMTLVNADIQTNIINLRSTGGTPTAAMLRDIREYFDTHPDVSVPAADGGDYRTKKCRPKFVLLITDGEPTSSYTCGYSNASQASKTACSLTGGIPTDYNQAEEQRAEDLYSPGSLDGGGERSSVRVYVVGFVSSESGCCPQTCSSGFSCQNVPGTACASGQECVDTAVYNRIQSIASNGGGEALFATSGTTLKYSISAVLNKFIAENTSRTKPASSLWTADPALDNLNSCAGPDGGMYMTRYNVSAAMAIPENSIHWAGYLRRTVFGLRTADGGGTDVGPITEDNKLASTPNELITKNFDLLLNGLDDYNDTTPETSRDVNGNTYTRKIYTYLSRNDSGKTGRLTEFTTSNITATDLGVSSDSTRNEVVNFVRCEPGSARHGNCLGPIYHSHPVIVEPPSANLPLASFLAFKNDASESNNIRQRQVIVLVGDNLGILHAFDLRSGKELWAFIPPILLTTLKDQLSGFTYGVDGQISVTDIRLHNLTSSVDSRGHGWWRTYAVVGLREGGKGYFAIEMSKKVHNNPGVDTNPPFVFRWQLGKTLLLPFGDVSATENVTLSQKMGYSYARATMGKVYLNDITYPDQERAVAILPGGKTDATAVGGRIWVVNLETGDVIKRFDIGDNKNLLSACMAHDQSPLSVLTRAYCGGENGQLYRLDLSGTNLSDWTLSPVAGSNDWYKLFDGGTTQSIHEVPAYAQSTKLARSVMVAASGNTANIDSTAYNRMAIVKEDFAPDGGSYYFQPSTIYNAQFPYAGEKLMGSPVIWNGVAYMTTFVPDSSDDCRFGRAQLWGFDFDELGADGGLYPALDIGCPASRILEADGGTYAECNPSTSEPCGTGTTAADCAMVGTDISATGYMCLPGPVERCLLPYNTLIYGVEVQESLGQCYGSTGGVTSPYYSATPKMYDLVFQAGIGSFSDINNPLWRVHSTGGKKGGIDIVKVRLPQRQAGAYMRRSTTMRIISWSRVPIK